MMDTIKLLNERAASYGALRHSSLTAVAMDCAAVELAALEAELGERVQELAAAHTTIHQLGENAAKAAERVAVLEGAVERAANVFADYAEMHSAKGTEEGHAKARKNAGLAEELRAALTEPTDG